MTIETTVWIVELGAIFQRKTLLEEVNLFGCTGVLSLNSHTFNEINVFSNLLVSSNFKKLKSDFNNKALLDLALTHKSASKNNNERLEFLGDAIINFYVAEKLFETYIDLQEGKLTQLRASLVSRNFLNSLGLGIGLSQELRLGKGESTENNSIIGNALEAIVGAIFLDSGLENTKKFLDGLYFEKFENLQPDLDSRDSKSHLQEILQKKGLPLPTYQLVDHGPKYNDDRFVSTCSSEDLAISAMGKGKTKKIAEQEAAKLLLEEHFKNE